MTTSFAQLLSNAPNFPDGPGTYAQLLAAQQAARTNAGQEALARKQEFDALFKVKELEQEGAKERAKIQFNGGGSSSSSSRIGPALAALAQTGSTRFAGQDLSSFLMPVKAFGATGSLENTAAQLSALNKVWGQGNQAFNQTPDLIKTIQES